jgi:hypothetical protein
MVATAGQGLLCLGQTGSLLQQLGQTGSLLQQQAVLLSDTVCCARLAPHIIQHLFKYGALVTQMHSPLPVASRLEAERSVPPKLLDMDSCDLHAQLCLQGSDAAAYLLVVHARCCNHFTCQQWSITVGGDSFACVPSLVYRGWVTLLVCFASCAVYFHMYRAGTSKAC